MNNEIKKICEKYANTRAGLIEEMILRFIETGASEWQLIERRTSDGCVLTLEKRTAECWRCGAIKDEK